VEHLADYLVRGAHELGIELGPREAAALEQHLRLLSKWNAKLNLVGPGTVEEWAARHTLDSLAIAEWIEPSSRVVDVGSGAGFPGIPCAVVRPESSVVLLEPRSNRAAFLQNVVAIASLSNAQVRAVRAADEVERFELVMGRAVAPLPDWAALATRLCRPGGRFAVFALGEAPETIGNAERLKLRSYSLWEGDRRSVALYVPRGT
jgi:16S rRNA (guanine527-N7)-methyltransferase